jgi:type II secretory pathway pseudopilin PulG
MNAKINKKHIAGQIMLESIVAISIIVIALLGIFDLLSRSLSTNRIAGNQYVASNLASEGIEMVKNLIDNNVIQGTSWNAGLNPGIYEIAYDNTNLEIIDQIDSNPDNCTPDFVRQNAQLLTFDPATGLYAYGLPNPTIYKRAVCVKNLSGDDELKVNSIVTWTTRGDANFEINLEGHYFNWRL